MSGASVGSRWNVEVIEDYYQRWRKDPGSVDESWRHFFEGFELGSARGAGRPAGEVDSGEIAACACQAGVSQLVEAYREVGHYLAHLDPLNLSPRLRDHEAFALSEYGLSEADLDRMVDTELANPRRAALRELIAILRRTYCGTIGVEYMHIQDRKARSWLQERMETVRNKPDLGVPVRRRILLKLYATTLFENFLHSHYLGQKRFSLEGGEMLIPILDAVVERCGTWGAKEIVLGMPHRGRLNVLANILNKPYGVIFNEFEGNRPKTVQGDGDVKYHLGYSGDHTCANGNQLHLSLTANPSHLEAVDPVVEGRARAKQRRLRDSERRLVLPILIHGDAAFSGQGLVAETLNLSQLSGYRTGGTIHIVVNNQIGFTTMPQDLRSTRYCTDVAKMIEAPIFHVNGEDPEACVYVAELATDFRQTFGRDVVVDMVCYRKHGHNEGDEPAFTQPLMYAKIRERPSITELYTEHLILTGDLTTQEAETIAETYEQKLKSVYEEVRQSRSEHDSPQVGFQGAWRGLSSTYSFTPVETGADFETLRHIADVTASVPPGFQRNSKLERILSGRVKTIESRGGIDWAFAETLAFGSLLMEGTPVRLSGQDSRRGTFSQRHSVLFDAVTGEKHIPLNHLNSGQAGFCVYDSLLSEAAVLGFDYGYSLDEPNMLILWEAQFGDFANGAQVIVDQFIASAESKWGRASGIVMLLPHGYEGQGPEHSSARLERYLQLCAEENLQVVYPTTPAQYFHVLRRQVKRPFRKPLIVMTPKSMLRLKDALSPVDDFLRGRFHETLADTIVPDSIRRVVLCSGKLYYELLRRRDESGKSGEVALVRIEQLYPWPEEQLQQIIARYQAYDVEWVWAQEESQNMGAWTFVAPRLRQIIGEDVQYVGRGASASPATGSHAVHEREQRELVEAAIGAAVPHLV
jgi:2-oxoglutarate dehydrogenase E1 component